MAVNKIETKKNLDRTEDSQIGSNARAYPSSYGLIVIVTVGAAVLELLLYRTFSRVGVFIPKDGDKMATFRTVYQVSVQLGTIVLNFSVVMALISLLMGFARFRRGGEFGALPEANVGIYGKTRNQMLTVTVFASSVVIGLSLALLWLVQSELASFSLRLALLVAFGALAVDMWLRHTDWRWRWFAGLMFGSYFLQIGVKIFHDSIAPRVAPNLTDALYLPLLNTGECLVLINSFVLFMCVVRPNWIVQQGAVSLSKTKHLTGDKLGLVRELRRHWVALVAALVLTAIFTGLTFLTVADSFIVPILALYGLGYAMQLPFALYVIALFFILFTIFYCLGRWKTHKALALGLILILVGGYTFNITQQYLFALVGVLLIARPELLD